MAIQRFIPEKPPLEPAVSSVTWKWFFQLYHFIQGLVRPDVIQLVDFTPTSRYFYPCDATAGNITVKLPVVASTEGKTYLFTKIDSSANTITLDVVGSDTIDGASNIVLSTQWTTVELYSNGVGTWIVRIFNTGGSTPPSNPSITATTPIIVTPSPITGTGVISHAAAGTAGTYGDSTHVPVVTTNATGHVTGVTLAAISGGGSGTVTNVTGTAPIVITGASTTTPNVTITDFVASGASHARGSVPDPGSSAGTTKFLCEDATFKLPPGGLTSPLTTLGDIWAYSTADGRFAVGPNGYAIQADSTQTFGLKWVPNSGFGIGGNYFGDGSDGDVTVTTAITLTRDMYYHNLTISGGGALNAAGFRIQVQNILDITAAGVDAIHWTSTGGSPGLGSGGPGGGGSTGVAATLQVGTTGGSGSTGSNTGAVLPGSGSATVAVSGGGLGGAGGIGGASSLGIGGLGGTGGACTDRHLHRIQADLAYITSINTIQVIAGGSGGGGGGGGHGSSGGSGAGGSGAGAGGNVIYLAALIINRGGSTPAGCIAVRGGPGGGASGTPVAAGAAGGAGGGGGGGGYLYIICSALTGSSSIANAVASIGGAGGAGGAAPAGGGVGGTGGTGGQGGWVQMWLLSTNTVTAVGLVNGSAAVVATTASGTAGGAGGISGLTL